MGTVQSVEVAAQILDVLAQRTGPVRVTELARHLGMTKARVSRHLQTLTQLGLVDRAKDAEGYVFGWKLLQLGRAAVYRNNIADIARRNIAVLREAAHHTSIFATPIKGGAIVILSSSNPLEASVSLPPGTVLTLPNSPSARLISYFQNGRKGPGLTKTNLKRLGVDFEAESRGNGLGGIAAPVFEADGNIAGTVGLVLSTSLLVPEPQPSLITAVRKCAKAIQDEYAPNANPQGEA